MAVVRALLIQLGLKDDASGQIEGIDESVSGMRDNIAGTQDNVSDLTDETSEFGYSATRDMQDVGSQTGELENQTRSLGDRFRGVADSIGRNWNAIAAGAAGAGAALEGFARSQQELIETSDRLAYSTGIQQDVIRDMAVEMSDATFSIEDAYGLMELGRRQGIESAEQLQEYAQFWDMVGDATGENAVQLAKSSVALRALGIEAGEEEEALGAFGFITQETTGSVSDFLTFIERTGPELREMGMDIDEAAAVTGALERELGLTARMARQEFRKAVNEAEGDTGELLEVLGLTEKQMADYTGQIQESSGVVKDLAEIHAENRTYAQELQAQMDGLIHQYGAEFMPIIEMLSPALMGLGTAMGVAAGAKYLLAGVAVVAGAKIIAVIGGIIGIGWLLYENWGNITEGLGDRWDTFSQRLDNNLKQIRALPSQMRQWGSDMIEGLADGISSGVDWLRESVRGVRDTIVGGITDFFGISSPSTLMMEYGVNLGEGLELGLERESRSMLDNMGRSFSPERDGRLQAVGTGSFSPSVTINVNGSGDPEGTAEAVDRRLRQTFDTHAERYFGRKKRKRPRN